MQKPNCWLLRFGVRAFVEEADMSFDRQQQRCPSPLLACAAIFVASTTLGSCGTDSSGSGGPTSTTSSTAGSGGTSGGATASTSAISGASGSGGDTSGAAGSGGGVGGMGGSSGGSAGAASGHCGPIATNLARDITTCSNYDPVANGIPGDPGGLRVASFTLASAPPIGQPLAISQNVRSGSGTMEYWGTDKQCGPGLQKLGARVAAIGIGCFDSTPTASYLFILSVIRMDMASLVTDERFCASTSCPK